MHQALQVFIFSPRLLLQLLSFYDDDGDDDDQIIFLLIQAILILLYFKVVLLLQEFWSANAFIFWLIDLCEPGKFSKFFLEGEGEGEDDEEIYSSFSTTFI